MEESEGFGVYRSEAYRSLPCLYLAFTSIWFVSTCYWTLNTYKNRHFQTNKLQWTLASVALIKALQLTLSFLFWYSCFNLHTCSLWMSFGAYVTGVLFQTASFVSFLLISHGYCIVCEHLSVSERRTTTALGCAFYLTLVGYRASAPYFSVLLLLNYLVSFYLIFHHTYRNLSVLREQLAFIEDEDVHLMHDAIHAKYVMFKKFQDAMQIIAVTETAIYINMDGSLENYWLQLFIREWARFCIFLYIGWTFRSQDLAPRFFVMPTLESKGLEKVPPIYSIEMDAATFKGLSSDEWHIGVPTAPSHGGNLKDPSHGGNLKDSIPVIVQHPHAYRITSVNATSPSLAGTANSAPDANPGAGRAKEQLLAVSPRSTKGMK